MPNQALRWERRPQLRRPVFVIAFEGWNDAGDAASLALSCLAAGWDAERFATIDSEDFYDFTSTRPQVEIRDSGRAIVWPDVELLAAELPGSTHDVVLVRGEEPHLRWRSFCRAVVEAADDLQAEMAVTLGALLTDVPHSRPVRLSGSSDDQELAGRLGLRSSSYQGPTGIIGVLHQALRDSGVPAASLWAAVPHYVHQVPSPKAALALAERASALLGADVDVEALRDAAGDYEREVDERVAADPDAAAYVAQLEEADDTDRAAPGLTPRSGDELAAEVERFLREHRREG